MTDVCAVIVTYNSTHYLDRCLKALEAEARASSATVSAVVVDNASSDGSAAQARTLYPAAHVIANSYNAGFAVATNQGIVASEGRYYLLLNPDAVLAPGSVDALVQYMDAAHDVGVVACRLTNDDGSLQPSIGRFPDALNQVGQALMLHRLAPNALALQEIDPRPERYDTTTDVDWAYGAVLMVRASAIDDVGLLDESFFLFSEEEDWCMRMHHAGWRVTYTPIASAIHLGRAGETKPAVYRLLLRSKLQFVRKHHGDAAAEALRVLLVVGHVLRLPLWFAVSRARPERRDAALRVQACTAGLRTLIREWG